MPNRLAAETSPYLKQHEDNPVDWYPWGEEALARGLVLGAAVLAAGCGAGEQGAPSEAARPCADRHSPRPEPRRPVVGCSPLVLDDCHRNRHRHRHCTGRDDRSRRSLLTRQVIGAAALLLLRARPH